MSKGYVYILSNECMPGLVKIGMTTRTVESRTHELFQTGVPTEFKVEASVYSPNCAELERWLHEHFVASRVYVGREFFRIDVHLAVTMMRNFLIEQVRSFICDFAEGMTLVEEGFAVDPAAVGILADELGEHPFSICDALSEITADELRPALARHHARAERWKADAE